MSITEIFLHVALFLTLYFQVFALLTHFVWSPEDIDKQYSDEELPTVSIMVPCWNEENTVAGTIESLLALNYPKNKLFILAIDDGSTDNTWVNLQQFANNPQVKLLQKQNEGSKFSALNFGLDYVTTDIVGCLDADSHVHPMALRYSTAPFIADPEVMCVVPSMIIDRPKSFWQIMQKPEYEAALFLKKIQNALGAIYVAPGPLSVFRKTVFEKIGKYKEAHHTEDLEIALRMQMNHMKIVYAENSIVYTKGPVTWRALLKQRVRWTYGFLKNMFSKEYLPLLFSSKYGSIGQLILPFAIISIVLVVIGFPLMIFGLVKGGYNSFVSWSLTGYALQWPSFDLFFVTVKTHLLLTVLLLGITGWILYTIRKHTLKTKVLTWDIASLLVYPFFASWWVIRSAYNAIRSKKESWR